MKEQYEEQDKLVGNDKYAVFVDATKNSIASKEVRDFMANHIPPNRLATAIITNNNLAINVIANFYLRVHQPKVLTKLFSNENDAVDWLKRKITKSGMKTNA